MKIQFFGSWTILFCDEKALYIDERVNGTTERRMRINYSAEYELQLIFVKFVYLNNRDCGLLSYSQEKKMFMTCW